MDKGYRNRMIFAGIVALYLLTIFITAYVSHGFPMAILVVFGMISLTFALGCAAAIILGAITIFLIAGIRWVKTADWDWGDALYIFESKIENFKVQTFDPPEVRDAK